jgi:hypothetical protein
VLPDKTVLPDGFDPGAPSEGAAPYFGYYEARSQVVLNGGGTIRRVKKAALSA